MKFYGVYVSKNNESLRKQILESGIFPLSELIKGKEKMSNRIDVHASNFGSTVKLIA
jgi:hypothetical protein